MDSCLRRNDDVGGIIAPVIPAKAGIHLDVSKKSKKYIHNYLDRR